METESPGAWYHRMMNSSADVWADEFIAATGCTIDRDILVAWFANAYMAGYDKATGQPINGDHAAWLIDNGHGGTTF